MCQTICGAVATVLAEYYIVASHHLILQLFSNILIQIVFNSVVCHNMFSMWGIYTLICSTCASRKLHQTFDIFGENTEAGASGQQQLLFGLHTELIWVLLKSSHVKISLFLQEFLLVSTHSMLKKSVYYFRKTSFYVLLGLRIQVLTF